MLPTEWMPATAGAPVAAGAPAVAGCKHHQGHQKQWGCPSAVDTPATGK